MSAIGGALGRLVGTLGGPQAAVVVVVAGLVVGGIGGGLLAGGGLGGIPASPEGELGVYPCPDQGPALTTVRSGQSMLVTGRSEDGGWLRIHYPLPGRSEAWVPAGPVTLKASLASLPVAGCAPELAAAAPPSAPAESLTPLEDNPPTAAPTPSPTANVGPVLASLKPSATTVSYDPGAYCPSATKRVTFTVRASDPSGVAGVTLFWRAPGAPSYASAAMSLVSGSATSGTWQATLDTAADGIASAGKLAYYAVAADTDGATGRLPAGSAAITVAVCQNTGPTIASAVSSSGSSLFWDPLGVGTCQTASNITASVRDTDGVASVTLLYQRPGDTAWSSKAMSQTGAGAWLANLDTLGDRITIPKPPTGTLRWYVRAKDAKGASSQTKAQAITVRRCDSEAVFGNSDMTSWTLCAGERVTFYGSATDRDSPTASTPLRAVLVYSYRSTSGARKTVRVAMKSLWISTLGSQGWTLSVSFTPPSDVRDGNRLDSAVLSIETTDVFGGTSQGGSMEVPQVCLA